MDARYLPAGECALTVEFGATAEPEYLDKVLALDAALAAAPIEGVVETVPTYRSLMVHFDPAVLGAGELVTRLAAVDLAEAPAPHAAALAHPRLLGPAL